MTFIITEISFTKFSNIKYFLLENSSLDFLFREYSNIKNYYLLMLWPNRLYDEYIMMLPKQMANEKNTCVTAAYQTWNIPSFF